LRERREDILPIARAYLERACLENGKKAKRFSKGAEERLLSYDWPGNVREVANAMGRVSVLNTPDLLEAKDFP